MTGKLSRDLKPKQLLQILQSLGLKVVGKRGSHVRLKHADGRWTQVAIHPKPIPQGTLSKILRQIGLSTDDLKAYS